MIDLEYSSSEPIKSDEKRGLGIIIRGAIRGVSCQTPGTSRTVAIMYIYAERNRKYNFFTNLSVSVKLNFLREIQFSRRNTLNAFE